MAISTWMASLALINGTAGGIVLVLPIIGLEAGWLMIPIIIFIASLCCYYTATLMFMHLGKAQTINHCILNHFSNHKFCDFYNFTMFASFFGEMILYYDLLVSETQGILYFSSDEAKFMMPFFVAVFLIILAIVTRYFHEEDYLLGYGILSMVAYAIFIVWIMTKKTTYPESVPIAKETFVELGAAMSQGYSIHNMMIPIILRCQNPQDYKKILINVFVIGGLFYTFVAYGSFGLINRHPLSGSGDIVEDYFVGNKWEIFVLRAIYIINIITVFPEFLSISKYYFFLTKIRIRFFNMFCEEEELETQLSLKEIIYYVMVVGVCLLARIMNLRAPTIIELNGSVICFVEIYLIPIGIHLKCIWWDWGGRINENNNFDHGEFAIEHFHDNHNTNIIAKHSILKTYPLELEQHNAAKDVHMMKTTELKHDEAIAMEEQLEEEFHQQEEEKYHYYCPCHNEMKSNTMRYTHIGLSLVILCYGMFIMLYTFYTVFVKSER